MNKIVFGALAALVGYAAGAALPAVAQTNLSSARQLTLSWSKQEISGALAAPLMGKDELVTSSDRTVWKIRRSDGAKPTAGCQVMVQAGTVPLAMELTGSDGTYVVSNVARDQRGLTSARWIPSGAPPPEASKAELPGAWQLMFEFASGQRDVRATMLEGGRKGEVQCWGLAEAVNRIARQETPGGRPDYRAMCEARK